MMRHLFIAASVVLLVSAVPLRAASGPAAAESPAPAELSVLQERFAAQQDRIAALEQRLAADQPDVERTRMEMLRKQIREILSETEFRESLMPSTLTAGYEGGFYLKSSDDNYSLKINGQLQYRWTYYNAQKRNKYLQPRLERDDRTGFEFNRLRISFSGNAGSPDLTYFIQLGSDASGSYDTALYYASIDYRFTDAFQIRAGIFDLATTRNAMSDDFAQHFVDRPMFDAVYDLGTGLGVRFWGQLANKRVEYFIDIVNSTSDGESTAAGRVITNDPAELDGNPAAIGRLVWHAIGENPPNDFLSESDLDHLKSPALDLGIHYAFNDDNGDKSTTRLPFPLIGKPQLGGYGLTTINGTQINQFGIDGAFKWNGFSALAEYTVRTVDPRRAWRRPFTPFWRLTGEDSTVAQHGAMLSVGYFLPIPGLEKKLEIVARVGGISALAQDHEGTWEYAGGLNYYINGNNVKLQADVTKIYEAPISSSYSSLANVNDDVVVYRVQLQVGF